MSKNNVWALLGPLVGPLLSCCLLFVILFRATGTTMGLPLIALGGVLICHMFKWRGVAIASTFLAAMLAYNLSHQPAAVWPWTIVLALCAASTFVVTVLCSEETSQNWDKLSKDADDSKQTISHLSEIVAAGNKKLIHERNEVLHHNEQLKGRLQEIEGKLSSYERAAKLARDEMAAAYAQQEKILQELYNTRQQNATLADVMIALQETEATNLTNTTLVKDKTLIAELQKEIEAARQDHVEAKRQLGDALAASHQESLKAEMAASELALLKQEQKAYLTLEKVNEELRLQHQIVVEEMNAQVESLLSEHAKQLSARLEVIARLEQELAQARQSNDEVKEKLNAQVESLLSDHAKQLSAQQEVIARLEHELEQAKHSNDEVKEKLNAQVDSLLSDHAKQLTARQEVIARLEQELAQARHSNDEVKEKLNAQIESLLSEHAKQLSARQEVIARLELDLAQAKQVQAQVKEEAKDTTEQDREVRRLTGLYQQLRLQFNEKSDVLAATRRELFQTQEKLLALQKDLEETRLHEETEAHSIMRRLLAEAENELEAKEHEHALESSHLHAVIDTLLCR